MSCLNLGDIDYVDVFFKALEFLKSDQLKTEVQRMVSCAQRNEVKGVPFTIIEGRWAISGGQSSDVFFEVCFFPPSTDVPI